jgi:hypothetical protein
MLLPEEFRGRSFLFFPPPITILKCTRSFSNPSSSDDRARCGGLTSPAVFLLREHLRHATSLHRLHASSTSNGFFRMKLARSRVRSSASASALAQL